MPARWQASTTCATGSKAPRRSPRTWTSGAWPGGARRAASSSRAFSASGPASGRSCQNRRPAASTEMTMLSGRVWRGCSLS